MMAASNIPGNAADPRRFGENAWYLRRGTRVEGPYPAGLVRRYVLLGRIQPVDEVSHDGVEWHRVRDLPQLVPDILDADPGDPQAQQRLEAARRWADERQQAGELRGGIERREPESPVMVDHRVSLKQRLAGRHSAFVNRMLSATLLPLLIVAGFVVISLKLIGERDLGGSVLCQAPPRPGINWNNCRLAGIQLPGADLANASLSNADLTGAVLHGSRLAGADLRYVNAAQADLRGADLEKAQLVGSILRGADLSNARLKDAVLSYADLTAANLAGSDLQGARLDHAIWNDGETCLAGSIGQCLVVD
jgi:uncharacterized protein YjbI with pentapeptide repeats